MFRVAAVRKIHTDSKRKPAKSNLYPYWINKTQPDQSNVVFTADTHIHTQASVRLSHL